MKQEDSDAAIARYREGYARFGYDPRALGWSKGSQPVRFAAVMDGIGELGSVIDVGCGFGDLFAFLRARGFTGRYVGVDLVPEILEEGRRRYAADGAEFVCADITRVELAERAELVVTLGIFNHRLDDNLAFIDETLDAMWHLSSRVVVADFLCNTADTPRPDLYYADAGEILQRGLSRSRRVGLHHSYMPFEFQLKVWRDDQFTIDAPIFAPYLQFRAT